MAHGGINRLPPSYAKLKLGLHADGGNLYLQVTAGAKGNRRLSWIFRYQRQGGKARDMGLGAIHTVSLAEARETAREYRQLLRRGIDPIEHRDAAIAKNLAASAAVITFDEAAERFIRAHRSSWTNPDHAQQWPSSLKTYASPVIGRMDVRAIETTHIVRVLSPIWNEKTETATRLRGRIESILGWCATAGYRQGDNPARWRGHLENLLAKPGKIAPVKHLPALSFDRMPEFFTELSRQKDVGALALQFLILTAVRSLDVRNARCADVDIGKRTWTITALSKTRRELRVPLSAAAIAVLEKAGQLITVNIDSNFLFPGENGQRLSESSMSDMLKRLGRKDQMTVHGSRATFRTWAMEATNFPREIAELSLGHIVGSAVERAYQRGDALAKRAALMEAWGRYLTTPRQPGKVVHLRNQSA